MPGALGPGRVSLLDIRLARPDDIPTLRSLIAASARVLGGPFYAERENEAAIAGVYGVDSQLIADESYFVASLDGRLAGCGGWSWRDTMFGGDQYGARTTTDLDPRYHPARIRAFFVAPDCARRGVASALLARSEAAAVAHGFAKAMMMATLSGEPFYARHGYQSGERVHVELDGVDVPFVPMSKHLLLTSNSKGH